MKIDRHKEVMVLRWTPLTRVTYSEIWNAKLDKQVEGKQLLAGMFSAQLNLDTKNHYANSQVFKLYSAYNLPILEYILLNMIFLI